MFISLAINTYRLCQALHSCHEMFKILTFSRRNEKYFLLTVPYGFFPTLQKIHFITNFLTNNNNTETIVYLWFYLNMLLLTQIVRMK